MPFNDEFKIRNNCIFNDKLSGITENNLAVKYKLKRSRIDQILLMLFFDKARKARINQKKKLNINKKNPSITHLCEKCFISFKQRDRLLYLNILSLKDIKILIKNRNNQHRSLFLPAEILKLIYIYKNYKNIKDYMGNVFKIRKETKELSLSACRLRRNSALKTEDLPYEVLDAYRLNLLLKRSINQLKEENKK